ncbi:MAG TPA: ATP-dependent DNA ligase [Pseudonocardiaceae bacterium]|nr:ATP-dependent DNA ligase [Pseudonocardiaceae bacterium]
MLLADVVTTSAAVAGTRSRLVKVETLAAVVRAAAVGPSPETEVPAVVAFLVGQPLQGRIGTGWRTLVQLDVPPATEPTLTMRQVDAALTAVAATTGAGSAARRAELLTGLLGEATAREQEFLIRLLTGELRQGALEGVMVDAVAKAAGVTGEQVRRAFMLSGALPATAVAALAGGADALAAFRLRLGRPVRPMLASPGADLASALAELGDTAPSDAAPNSAAPGDAEPGSAAPSSTEPGSTETGDAELGDAGVKDGLPKQAAPSGAGAGDGVPIYGVVVEYKLDGARIQVHRDGDDVHIYTRTLREITSSVPELVELVRGLPCRSVVLDGETLALADDGRPRPFQETMSRFGAASPRELLLRPYFFDCLHLDGVDLLDAPLRTRTEALRRVAGPHVIPGRQHPSVAEANTLLVEALTAGHEGVLVKDLDSAYAAGRRGKAWQKVKPVHTLDLVVLAAEWGHGRRTGYLSNLHLGARDPASAGDSNGFVMVGKTFKGLTDELLAWQTTEFPQHELRRTDWTVYLRPAIVVEIALDGVQVSPRYPGKVALRFARVVRYRPDKEPADADTIDAVRALLPGPGQGSGAADAEPDADAAD